MQVAGCLQQPALHRSAAAAALDLLYCMSCDGGCRAKFADVRALAGDLVKLLSASSLLDVTLPGDMREAACALLINVAHLPAAAQARAAWNGQVCSESSQGDAC